MKDKKSAPRYTIIKFSIMFVLFCTAFYALFEWTTCTFEPINNYTATTLGFLLRVLGMQPSVQGVFVSVDSFGVEIIDECSAIFIIVLFSSFVLAYPTSFKNKAIGLLFGIPILFAVNTLRLVVCFIVGMWYPDLFEFIHVYFWQTIIIILVFIACFAWLRWMVMVPTKDTVLSFFVRFIAFSSILFLIWLYLDTQYVLVTTYISEFLLHCLGYPISICSDPTMLIYPSTFNLITFTALILATRSIERNTKLKALITGLPLMIMIEVIFGAYQALAELQVPHALEIMVALQIINQYFLPFALWLAFTYKDLFKRAGASICPICGAEKVGIVEHIRVKHGEKALEDERVKAVLEAQKRAFHGKRYLERSVEQIKKKLKAVLRKKK